MFVGELMTFVSKDKFTYFYSFCYFCDIFQEITDLLYDETGET